MSAKMQKLVEDLDAISAAGTLLREMLPDWSAFKGEE